MSANTFMDSFPRDCDCVRNTTDKNFSKCILFDVLGPCEPLTQHKLKITITTSTRKCTLFVRFFKFKFNVSAATTRKKNFCVEHCRSHEIIRCSLNAIDLHSCNTNMDWIRRTNHNSCAFIFPCDARYECSRCASMAGCNWP